MIPWIIARKELKLLFKSTRRILLLFMVPLIIMFLVLVVGFIAIFVVPSTTAEQPNIVVIQADEGLNGTIWGETFYAFLKNQSVTKNFLYTNESMSNFVSLKEEGNFDVLIFIPENFTQMINQSLPGQVFVFYDNSKLSNEDAVGSIAIISAIVNGKLVENEYGVLNLSRISTSFVGISKGSGALLASSLSIIPLYMILFLVLTPLTLVLISVTMEREQKTLESVLLQPIDRKQFIAGKILYGIVIILINTTLTISSILVVILALFFAMPADIKDEVNPILDQLVDAILALDLTFWLFIFYIIVGLIALSLLMVTAGVFFSLLAKDEREANMVISLITIIPIFGTFFLIYVPLGLLPDFVTILVSILPLLGYLFSIYQIFLLGELTSIIWLSLLAQFVWTAILIWLAGRLIESEGILQISFKRILRFWKKSH
jgi:ABC-type Na+ efflux pump permease subunit